MKKLLGLLLVVLLASCGSQTPAPKPLDASGSYYGTMTAQGSESVLSGSVEITAGAKSGYTAMFRLNTGNLLAFCGNLEGANLECITTMGLETLQWNGVVTETSWSGSWQFRDHGELTLQGDFQFSR
jgi:hypothetical protein